MFPEYLSIDIDLDIESDSDNDGDMGDDNSSTPSPINDEQESSDELDTSDQPAQSDYDNSSDGDVDFYEIDTDSEGEEFPTYNITNMEMTDYQNDLPELLQYDQDYYVNDWENEMIDSGPSIGPFHGQCRTQIQDVNGNPEVFFQGLFDDRMWTIISESTNSYARSKSMTPTGNRCVDPTHPDYRKHCQLNTWSDTSPSDIKMFAAHTLIMGLVKKADLEKYWNMITKAKVPFFRQYVSRNRYQSLLWNFHINDDSANPTIRATWT